MSTVPAPDRALQAFVVDQGLARAGDAVTWTPLAGGVSSDIWRVDLPRRRICIKRALAKLKVADEWNAPVSRNAYEWRWLRFAAQHAPGSAPEPLAHDAEQGILAMSYLEPERNPVWKTMLLQGIAQPEVATAAGTTLARLHAASAGKPEVAASFDTFDIFFAIRLEPYLLATAARHPALAPILHGLADRTGRARIALVHGDVSPKNILVGPTGPVFLDAECAWYGDPAFDVAFCLNHFLLKCLARRDVTAGFLACYDALARAYLAGVTWEDATAIEARVATLLPGLLLARIDGKSPVEYVTDPADKDLTRGVASALLRDAPARLDTVARQWREALGRRAVAPG